MSKKHQPDHDPYEQYMESTSRTLAHLDALIAILDKMSSAIKKIGKEAPHED
ncbi:MAG: hypothetical protein ACI4WX_00675 [Aristaeellaceae bacterium]